MRRRPRVVALMRIGYRIAYRLLLAWCFVARPRVRGVKCVLRDRQGRAIFVRHNYGRRDRWELPGGGVHRGEEPLDAARREAREELGVDVASWRELGQLSGPWQFKREVLTCFAAPFPGGELDPDPVEIGEVAWFDLDAPPAPLGPATVDVLALIAERRPTAWRSGASARTSGSAARP